CATILEGTNPIATFAIGWEQAQGVAVVPKTGPDGTFSATATFGGGGCTGTNCNFELTTTMRLSAPDVFVVNKDAPDEPTACDNLKLQVQGTYDIPVMVDGEMIKPDTRDGIYVIPQHDGAVTITPIPQTAVGSAFRVSFARASSVTIEGN